MAFAAILSSTDACRWFNTVSVTEGYDYTFAFVNTTGMDPSRGQAPRRCTCRGPQIGLLFQ
jgi:hypothetical protein